MSIGNKIKFLRESKDLTQVEFGKIAGVSDKAVSTWENGSAEPRMGAIQKIADYFGISKGWIVDDETDAPDAAQLDSLFIEKYGQNAFDHAMQYNRLDDRDQGKVDGFVASLLEDDKYKGAESSDAKAI